MRIEMARKNTALKANEKLYDVYEEYRKEK